MSNPTPAFVPVSAEKTFSSYTQDQGANYAQNRTDYHPNLYKTVIDHHTFTGGQLNTLLDVGCGPGTAARALAPHFAYAIGLDPSEGMINNARFLAGASSSLNTRIGWVKGTPDLSLICVVIDARPTLPSSVAETSLKVLASRWELPGGWRITSTVATF